MFKSQRKKSVSRPIKDTAIYEEEEEYEESEEDNSSSCYSNGITAAVTTQDSRKDTMLLAQFLLSTGPEELVTKDSKSAHQQFKRASRLLNRLRKKPVMPVLRSGSHYVDPPIKRTHIPLPAYEPPPLSPIEICVTPTPIVNKSDTSVESAINLRDSGVYSETNSDTSSAVTVSVSVPPVPVYLFNDLQQFPQPPTTKLKSSSSPRRPAPLPPAVASAAIATACSISSVVRTVPEAALKRKSVRLRHVQVQTEIATQTADHERQACPHCRLAISPTSKDFNRLRRPSCPPALSSGPVLSSSQEAEDAKALIAMIHTLKSQLAEEKQCRLDLEKLVYQRQSEDRIEQLAKEKDRWAGDCLWLNDRIALLPE